MVFKLQIRQRAGDHGVAMKMNGWLSYPLFVLLLGAIGLLGTPMGAGAGDFGTVTQTQTSLTNNSVFGCEACQAITSPTDPHPDTSHPIFLGDPRASALPSSLANLLPGDNQFGNGLPDGSTGLPIHQSTDLALANGDGTRVSSSNAYTGTPVAGGGRLNTISQTVEQFVPGGGSSATGVADQDFSIHFQLSSLTDPDGKQVGAATGTVDQTLNGVQSTNSFTFDQTNGLTSAQPFPNPTVGP